MTQRTHRREYDAENTQKGIWLREHTEGTKAESFRPFNSSLPIKTGTVGLDYRSTLSHRIRFHDDSTPLLLGISGRNPSSEVATIRRQGTAQQWQLFKMGVDPRLTRGCHIFLQLTNLSHNCWGSNKKLFKITKMQVFLPVDTAVPACQNVDTGGCTAHERSSWLDYFTELGLTGGLCKLSYCVCFVCI